jgi:hypothetical protein
VQHRKRSLLTLALLHYQAKSDLCGSVWNRFDGTKSFSTLFQANSLIGSGLTESVSPTNQLLCIPFHGVGLNAFIKANLLAAAGCEKGRGQEPEDH